MVPHGLSDHPSSHEKHLNPPDYSWPENRQMNYLPPANSVFNHYPPVSAYNAPPQYQPG